MTDKQQSVQELREALDIFLSGGAGVPFETLAHFAEPLFELYQVDLRASLQHGSAARDKDELASLLAVLETARLLWAYFHLDEQERRDKLPQLEQSLIGHEADEEERLDFLQLLSVMQEQWTQLDPDQRVPADDASGYAPPSFDRLLTSYDPDPAGPQPASPAARYGPNELEPAEAHALFAQPLIEQPDVLEDPDKLEAAMDRADAYWKLAQAPPAQYPEHLQAIKQRFADDPKALEQLEEEASDMVDRFFELFPEQQTR